MQLAVSKLFLLVVMRKDENETGLIDLTSDEIPVNPLNANIERETRTRKRKRTQRRSLSLDDTNLDDYGDIEITDVVKLSNDEPRRRGKQLRGDKSSLAVIDETKLTPQQKLERIRAQHSMGKAIDVQSRQNSQSQTNVRRGIRLSRFTNLRTPENMEQRYPLMFMLNSLMDPRNSGLIPPDGLFPMSHENSGADGPIGANGLNRRNRFDDPDGLFVPDFPFNPHMPTAQGISERNMMHPDLANSYSRNPQQSIEENIIRQTIQRSFDQISGHKSVTLKDLHLPADPAAPAEGYTRDVSVDSPLLCVNCDHELGKIGPDGDSYRVFVRGCGHVYCGQCTMKQSRLSGKKSRCPAPNCFEIHKKLRNKNKYREVYI